MVDSTTMRDEWARNTQKRIGRGPKPPATPTSNTPLRPLAERQRTTPLRDLTPFPASDIPPAKPLARTDETIPDYDVSRARTEHLKAELLELERKQKEKILVKAEEIEAKWVEIITLARTKLLGIPTKAKQRIPDLDTDAISLLDDIVREALEDIASTAPEGAYDEEIDE